MVGFFFSPSYVYTMIEKTNICSILSLSFPTQKTQSFFNFFFDFFSSCGIAGSVLIWCISLFPFVVDVFVAIVVVFVVSSLSVVVVLLIIMMWVISGYVGFFLRRCIWFLDIAGLFEKSFRIWVWRIWVVVGFEVHFRGVVRMVCVCGRIGGSRKLRCVWSSNLSLLDINLAAEQTRCWEGFVRKILCIGFWEMGSSKVFDCWGIKMFEGF